MSEVTIIDGLRVMTTLAATDHQTYVSVVGEHGVTDQLRVTEHANTVTGDRDGRYDVDAWRPTGWVPVLRALDELGPDAAAAVAFRVLHATPPNPIRSPGYGL